MDEAAKAGVGNAIKRAREIIDALKSGDKDRAAEIVGAMDAKEVIGLALSAAPKEVLIYAVLDLAETVVAAFAMHEHEAGKRPTNEEIASLTRYIILDTLKSAADTANGRSRKRGDGVFVQPKEEAQA